MVLFGTQPPLASLYTSFLNHIIFSLYLLFFPLLLAPPFSPFLSSSVFTLLPFTFRTLFSLSKRILVQDCPVSFPVRYPASSSNLILWLLSYFILSNLSFFLYKHFQLSSFFKTRRLRIIWVLSPHSPDYCILLLDCPCQWLF